MENKYKIILLNYLFLVVIKIIKKKILKKSFFIFILNIIFMKIILLLKKEN